MEVNSQLQFSGHKNNIKQSIFLNQTSELQTRCFYPHKSWYFKHAKNPPLFIVQPFFQFFFPVSSSKTTSKTPALRTSPWWTCPNHTIPFGPWWWAWMPWRRRTCAVPWHAGRLFGWKTVAEMGHWASRNAPYKRDIVGYHYQIS